MINFDALTLKAFLEENADFFLDARLQKIQQPTRQEFVFVLRNKGESRKFYVNINPNLFHLCFMSEENEARRFIKIPQKPPMFCMLLRKYLESAKIAKVEQAKNGDNLERILEFYFETYNELSEKIYLCLAIELMGKHSNICLYSYDTNVIIGCAHNVGSEKSREREMMGGLPYVYPPKSTRVDYIELLQFLKDSNQYQGSVNSTVDSYFAQIQESEKTKTLKSGLCSTVNAKLKKVKNSLDKIKRQMTSTDKQESYRKKGDLIMANLFHNKDFSTYIEVVDFETNKPLKIDLDETKTLKENANNYFKLYNKAKTAALKSEEFIKNLTEEKDYLEQIIYSLDSATNMAELLEIQDEINKAGWITKTNVDNKKNAGKQSISAKQIEIPQQKINNYVVYIGKNNKQNDYIVSKLSKDEDMWFHVHNCAGSHVLLKLEKGIEPDDKTIFECAKLAKEYSSVKDSSKVGVIYTKRKFLKKPPAANLGYVIYKNEKEIIID